MSLDTITAGHLNSYLELVVTNVFRYLIALEFNVLLRNLIFNLRLFELFGRSVVAVAILRIKNCDLVCINVYVDTGDLASFYEIKSVCKRYGSEFGNVFVYSPNEIFCSRSVTSVVIHCERSFAIFSCGEYVACCCSVYRSCEFLCEVSNVSNLKNGELELITDLVDEIKVVAFNRIVAVADVVNYLASLGYGVKNIVLNIFKFHRGGTCEHLHEILADGVSGAGII